jgi:hypothetical protein
MAETIFFFNFLWPQSWSLTPLPEVYTFDGEGGGIRTRVLAALPRSRPLAESIVYDFFASVLQITGNLFVVGNSIRILL